MKLDVTNASFWILLSSFNKILSDKFHYLLEETLDFYVLNDVER